VLTQELGLDEPGHEREPVLAALTAAPAAFAPALRQCLDSALDLGLAEGCALGLAEVHDTGSHGRVRAALDRGRVSARVGLSVLGRLGDARALSAALERLTATDAETRAAAMDAAEALLSPLDADGRAVEPLARALAARGVSRAERLRLVGLLGRTGSERALGTLLPLLQSSSDPALAESAAAALGSVPGKASGAALLGALDSDEVRVKRAAALAIRSAKNPELLGPLLTRFERAGRAERELLVLALFGSIKNSQDEAQLKRALSALQGARGAERDALLEALATSSRPSLRKALLELASGADVADRAKLAELLSAAPDVATLSRLVRDSDTRVRQNAAWSLGFAAASGQAAARSALERALQDRDAAVVGNAALSLGRLLREKPSLAQAALCGPLLRDARGVVREQALRGLQLARTGCADGLVGSLLSRDPRARVRRAAAELLLRAAPGMAERRLLSRCEEVDPHAVVAEACAAQARPDVTEREPTTVLIVASAGSAATPGAPFAVLWPDGSVRLGAADRRGAVHEPRAPEGPIELLPYAGGE
jgi:HEAT repeat protein